MHWSATAVTYNWTAASETTVANCLSGQWKCCYTTAVLKLTVISLNYFENSRITLNFCWTCQSRQNCSTRRQSGLLYLFKRLTKPDITVLAICLVIVLLKWSSGTSYCSVALWLYFQTGRTAWKWLSTVVPLGPSTCLTLTGHTGYSVSGSSATVDTAHLCLLCLPHCKDWTYKAVRRPLLVSSFHSC